MSATVQPDVEIPVDLLERGMMLSPAAQIKFANLLLKAAEAPPDDPELVRKEVNEVIADRIEGYLRGGIRPWTRRSRSPSSNSGIRRPTPNERAGTSGGIGRR